MKEMQMKTCPFCGQFAMMDPDVDPRDVCNCDAAVSYREDCQVFAVRTAALEKLCGEDAGKISAYYHPVGDETFALLKEILRGVVFDKIGKTVITLKDNTTLTISLKGVRRVAKVDLELNQ